MRRAGALIPFATAPTCPHQNLCQVALLQTCAACLRSVLRLTLALQSWQPGPGCDRTSVGGPQISTSTAAVSLTCTCNSSWWCWAPRRGAPARRGRPLRPSPAAPPPPPPPPASQAAGVCVQGAGNGCCGARSLLASVRRRLRRRRALRRPQVQLPVACAPAWRRGAAPTLTRPGCAWPAHGLQDTGAYSLQAKPYPRSYVAYRAPAGGRGALAAACCRSAGRHGHGFLAGVMVSGWGTVQF